jgi:hypothetical protein
MTPFASRRKEIDDLQTAIKLCERAKVLCKHVNAHDAECIASRRDAEVVDTNVREVVMSSSSRLGTMLADIDTTAHTKLDATFKKDFHALLMTGTRPPKTFHHQLDSTGAKLMQLRDILIKDEGTDSGSSSPSDTTGSDTSTSDEEEN